MVDRRIFIQKMRQDMRNIGAKQSKVSKNGSAVERTIP
jgi:hypothetical protein